MKHTAIATVVFLVSAGLGTASFAQGRHDDKPHGMPKDMPMATKDQAAPAPAGRHDEKPHGPKKPAAKKSADKPAADKTEAAK